MSAEEDSAVDRVVGWVLIILLGPINFTGELVGPLGGVFWRQWVGGILGTWLWIAVGWGVIQHI